MYDAPASCWRSRREPPKATTTPSRGSDRSPTSPTSGSSRSPTPTSNGWRAEPFAMSSALRTRRLKRWSCSRSRPTAIPSSWRKPSIFFADGEYRFRHALVRDVAYGTLSISHRQDLHEQVGRMLESTYADELERYVDLLAYHFGESRAIDKQRTYFRKAADAARAAYSNEA